MKRARGRQFIEPNEAERIEILGVAREVIERGGELEAFIDTGKLPHSIDVGGRTLGPLRDNRETLHDRKAVLLYRPTDEEVAETRAWHDYCAEHGYPIGDLRNAPNEPGSTYPPSPERIEEGVWVGLTWPVIRKELREADGPTQTDLLAGAVT